MDPYLIAIAVAVPGVPTVGLYLAEDMKRAKAIADLSREIQSNGSDLDDLVSVYDRLAKITPTGLFSLFAKSTSVQYLNRRINEEVDSIVRSQPNMQM